MKQFKPTQKRLQKAREEGKVLKSQLFTAFVGVLGMGVSIYLAKILLAVEPPVQLDGRELFRYWGIKMAQFTGLALVPYTILVLVTESLLGGLTFKIPKKKRSPFDSIIGGVKAIPGHLLKLIPLLGFILVLVLYGEGSEILFWIKVGLLVIGVVGLGELFASRHKFISSLSMSFQELRDEIKESEGDPYIKAMRGSIHRMLTYDEVVSRIRKSKVVVVG